MKQPEKVDVTGFEELQAFALSSQSKVSIGADSLQLVADSTLGSIAVVRGSDTLMVLDLAGAVKARGLAPDQQPRSTYSTVDAPVVIRGERRGLAIALVLTNGTGSHQGTSNNWSYVSGFVLMRGKK